jgi:hypothetical protein
MRARIALVSIVVLASASLGARSAIAAPFSFSIDLGSPTVPSVGNNDVLQSGPVGGPPTVLMPAASLGLPAVSADEIDAMSDFGVDEEGPFFSVDRASVGLPGTAVAAQAALGQAAGDIFRAIPGALHLNQRSLGLLPSILPGAPTAAPIDNLDALNFFNATIENRLYSLAPGNSLGVSGADLINSSGITVVTAAALGLLPGDDIDALQWIFSGYYFSLTPGSPSLAGSSPADIFYSPGNGSFSLHTDATRLGLQSTDNVVALAWLPEPTSFSLVGMGLLGLAGARRRRCHA